jgi:hypothetical protein
VAIRPAAGSRAAASLASSSGPALAKTLYKVSFPWTGIWRAYPLSFASDPAVGKDPRPLIGWSWSWRSSLLYAPLSLLSGPFRFWRDGRWRSFVSIVRLQPSSAESSADCWRSRPSSSGAGLLAPKPRGFLGRQPAYCLARGAPPKSSPRHFETAGLYRGHCACTASLEVEILVLPYTLDMVEHMERG